MLPRVDAPGCDGLVAKLPAAFGIDATEARAAFEVMDGWGAAGVRGDAVTRWVAAAALRTLCPPPAAAVAAPLPAEAPDAAGAEDDEGEDEAVAEEEEEEEAVADEEDEASLLHAGALHASAHHDAPPEPPGGLEPVLETTERSAFSTVGDWAAAGGGAGGSITSDGEADGTLGAASGFGSVKKGFFDASGLAEESGGGGPDEDQLRVRYQQAVAEVEATKKEVERLQSELAASRAAEQAERQRHTHNVRRMLDANEALQAQLRELNGVVERVVTKELDRQRGGPEKAGGKAGAFPAVAKPGARGQRVSGEREPAPGPKAKQEPPGAKPFK